MSLFNKIRFSEIDPLGGGLAEEIAAERAESDAIILEESIDGHLLSEQWGSIVDEASDAEWYVMANREGAE